MRVIFLGSPDFAVASLEALSRSKHEVVGVITQPDRPAGRGMNVKAPPVKIFAQSKGFEVHQTEAVNSQTTLEWLQRKNPDILTVVAFGEFLGKSLLKIAKYPPVNVHPSLLPELRGAAPVQWALLRGHETSGVTTQFMVSKMDAGDVLLQESSPLSADENSAELLARFGEVGGKLLVKTLDGLESSSLSPHPQDDSKATFAPLLSKADGIVDWSRPAKAIHDQIRGLYPWPAATTTWLGQKVKILRSRATKPMDSPQQSLLVGDFCFFGDALFVQTGAGFLQILELQPEGKRAMLPKEFANGIKGRQEQGNTHHFG